MVSEIMAKAFYSAFGKDILPKMSDSSTLHCEKAEAQRAKKPGKGLLWKSELFP